MRPLGSFETAQVLTEAASPLNVVLVVRLDRTPPEEFVYRALDAVQERHALLQVHLERRRRGFAFAAGAPPVPLEIVPRGGENSWLERVAEELAGRLDVANGPLLRVALLAGDAADAPSDLILTFQHLAVDASSGSACLAEILAHVAEQVRGEELSRLPSRALPPSLESCSPAAWRGLRLATKLPGFLLRQMRGELALRRSRRALPPPKIDRAARNRPLSRTLDTAATKRLVRACRRRALSLQSLLSAALLQIAADRSGGRSEILRHIVFPDLRPHLDPPFDDDVLGSAFTILPVDVHLPVPSDDPAAALWSLAERFSRDLLSVLHRGDAFLAPRLAPLLMRTILSAENQRMGDAALSYTGALRLPVPLGGPQVTQVHAFVSNLWLGPPITAQARIFQGCLGTDFVFLDTDFSDEEMDAIADDWIALLEAATCDDAPKTKNLD